MKSLLLVSCLLAGSAFAQTNSATTTTTNTTTTPAVSATDSVTTKVTEIKKKGCPMVNGKEDCTATEVKTKVMNVKKSITQ
jgi:hypothetical protein